MRTKRLRTNRMRSKRKIRGGAPRSGRSKSPRRDASPGRSRSRSRSKSRSRRGRSPSMSPIRGRADIRSIKSDLEAGINWLSTFKSTGSPEDIPGPNLSFNLDPIKNVATTIVKKSLSTMWSAINLVKDLCLTSKKVQNLIALGEQIVLYGKIVVAYLPTEKLSGNTLRGKVKPEPNEYNKQINDYKKQIESIKSKMNSIETKFGSRSNSEGMPGYDNNAQPQGAPVINSALVAKKYEEYSDDLTDIISEMHSYIDTYCGIIFAGDKPSTSRLGSINIPALVRTISNPLHSSGQLSYKKQKKKTKKKGKKKKKKKNKKK